ncbi:uncharacterized protein FA14DRAFT_173456 [Meira miltonrushii]|uniref:Vps72/YL1 C-terminal domain-containing protein n=1 Tax=Meira miltonrushii TaxID=1280837 RepID=A0A316V7U9_9BASI|nr:uncharacterized protein FA14DRAFT_173456 [Meira miltonrushii]PWN33687.1 hypothetical protein FA14DRAFT_173456 [Meira miltonrushii]
MSSTSTPAPGSSSLESKSFLNTPKPFKNPSYTKSSNRRIRNLKQILAAERDFAMGVTDSINISTSTTSAGGGGSHKKGAAAKQRRLLTGAAAKAAKRREEQGDISGTATPAEGEIGSASMTEPDGDTTMNSLAGTNGTQTPAVLDAAAEELLKRKRALPTYSSIEAPPSLRPRKKFCDITGLIAPYTDPKSGLRYHSVEIYEIIKTFGPGVDQSYLSLRGEASQIK